MKSFTLREQLEADLFTWRHTTYFLTPDGLEGHARTALREILDRHAAAIQAEEGGVTFQGDLDYDEDDGQVYACIVPRIHGDGKRLKPFAGHNLTVRITKKEE